jgi:hypothetical protein
MTYLAYALPYILSLALVVHCIKTGRSWIWVFVLMFLPLLGALAYTAVEILPELMRGRSTQRAARGLKKAINPFGDLRRLQQEAELTGNIASRQRYADELARHGRFAESAAQYRETLTGLYEHDPNLMLGLARAQFGNGEASAARATLEALMQYNPEFNSPERHLLYARALEAEGNVPRALEEYRALAHAYPGAEAAVRYAQLLQRQGQPDEARKIARELLDQARLAPAHYRRAQRTWLEEATRLL